MMAAYQPQPAMHPGMAPHGHPAMTPGAQPMNPAQMQQMAHPGVSGPGQPHVTQAGAMMGMQPGASGMAGMGGQPPGAQMGGMPGQMGGQSMPGVMPNAHAMNHMNPQAAMQQQQLIQQQMAQNPQFAMARQQEMMQRRAMAAQMQGMPGMQQNMPMNQQQLQHLQQQMQQNNPGMHPGQVQLPPHMMQQQLLLRQQQAHQQQQAQHQLAMQQANSQHSNQGSQPGQPNQQGAPAQTPGQMRPQSRMANPNEQNQAAAQQNAQQGQQGQAQGQQTQQGGQPQNPQQQQAQQQAQQAQQQAQQQMTPQQMQAMQQRRMMQMQQQQAAQNAMRQQMNQSQHLNGQAILFFLRMCDHICTFNESNGENIDMWRAFVDKHFAEDADLIHAFDYEGAPQSKQFRVVRHSIARYFQKYFKSGAQSIRIHTECVKEERTQPNNSLRVTSDLATLRVAYSNGARLEMRGTLSAEFAPSMVPEAIQQLTFYTNFSEEVIGRGEIERLLSTWSPTMSNNKSPKMTKKNLPKAQQKMQNQLEGLTIENFPKVNKGNWGGPAIVQTFLELGDNFNLMVDLISIAQEKRLRPELAVEAYNNQLPKEGQPGGDPNQQGNPQLNLPPNGIPMMNRTPSMQSMGMPNAQGQFSSPSVSHLNLPMQNGVPMNGSPHISNNPGLAPNMNMANSHTPSPHQGNMTAPQMIPQHSQQGTNSSAASANTSPNVNNKRRRSTVKMEGDDPGGDGGNANRVKPSPTMRKKAKP